MKTLLHVCCAPCANQCIDVLRGDHYEVTGYWYNPNIHPFTEYRARRNCLREYAQTIELPLIERNDYGLRPFVRAVADDIEHRCVKCYEFRLGEAARQAAEGGFDSFTSSLFISPYQQHELMREVAERAAKEYGVEFLYEHGTVIPVLRNVSEALLNVYTEKLSAAGSMVERGTAGSNNM